MTIYIYELTFVSLFRTLEEKRIESVILISGTRSSVADTQLLRNTYSSCKGKI